MALMTFGQSYSVGVKTVDDQHKVLFEIINDLHAAMMRGQAHSVTGPLLNKLLDYTRTHFQAEEAMMVKAKYPGLDTHKSKHRELINQVEDYTKRHKRGDISLNLHLLEFLRDWLTNHIQKVDKEYSPWMKEHNVL